MDINNKEKKIFIKQIKPMKLSIKLSLSIIGIILCSISLKWFVYPANILPGGLTGLSVLCQRIINENFNILIPITVFNVSFNLIPAIFCFFIVGKTFTILSFIILFAFSFIADYIPYVTLTTDSMVCCIFGGLISGFAASLWFRCGMSGGGTDFIAMSLSTKFHVQTFGWIFAFNVILVFIQGLLYGWEHSFYSIIYQYIMTQAINLSYRHYEARTLLIVTDYPEKVTNALLEESGHATTIIDAVGGYSKKQKSVLYTVVTQPEVRKVTNIVKKADSMAFINILKTSDVIGNFTYLPVNKDDIDTNYS